jgi:hypothetical protein
MVTLRFRSMVWFATGVALTLFATVLVMQTWRVDAAPGDSDSTFVPVTPCRLFDMRPSEAPSGGKKTPLAAGAPATQQVTGNIGNCSLPTTGVVAVSMNVTIVSPTAQSNLRVYPANVATPAVSNLNWLPGQSPTPNKVDVKLSSDGKIKLLNHAGTVYVLADVVGYYTDKSLKSFYTKAEVDALLAAPVGPGVLVLAGSSFQPTDVTGGHNGSFPVFYDWSPKYNSWEVTDTDPASSSSCYMAEAEFPAGAKFDLLKAVYATDGSSGGTVTLYRSNGGYDSDPAVTVATLVLPAPVPTGVRDAETTSFVEAAAVGSDLYLVEICQSWSKAFSDIQIHYTVPA